MLNEQFTKLKFVADFFKQVSSYYWGFPGGTVVKNLPANAGDLGSIPGSGRSPGGRNSNPLQYSCLKDSWTEKPGGPQSMGSPRVRHH